jgi:hypothetical protein
MQKDAQVAKRLKERTNALNKWLQANGGTAMREQRHLENNSTERLYWHHGYLAALLDVISLLSDQGRS